MPYQLQNDEIKLILSLFDTQGSQSTISTSQQQLYLRLSQALLSNVSDIPTTLDDLNQNTDNSVVSNYYI